MSRVQIRRALLSVSDKSYIDELARGLQMHGVEILATGKTAAKLEKARIPFRTVESYTGNPEAFDGRMKTLSFKLESALLYDRANPAHVAQAQELKIEPIDLVVCNFYPFEEAMAKDLPEGELIDFIDVGGPTMVRSAAKNYKSVCVITDPTDYQELLSELRQGSASVTLEFRKRTMVKAFKLTADYDRAIFEAFGREQLRYGENPHQKGFLMPERSSSAALRWELLEKSESELSYNNILDGDAAYNVVRDAKSVAPAGHGVCAIIKHNNPCGLASAPTLEEAFERAWAGDPVSAFGGVVAFSAPVTLEVARLFDKRFVEVVMAPDYEEGAIEEIRRKKKKLRLLKINTFDAVTTPREYTRVRVAGGYLVQEPDEGVAREDLKSVASTKFSSDIHQTAKFGVVAAKWIKSNAIAIVRTLPDRGVQLIGMGSGQPNRVDAIAKLAIPRAKHSLEYQGITGDAAVREELAKAILVSDAFFPFADNVEAAASAGIRFIVQPGGSVRDSEVIEACNKLGVAMAFTGKRHFRH